MKANDNASPGGGCSGHTVPTLEWSRRIPLRYAADVAVIGGGSAGVCAACAAAKEGASVILVERFAMVGGNATVGGVANWCGETAGQGAVFDDIITMQEEWDSIEPYPGVYRHHSSTEKRVFDHEILAVILQELLLKYGVKLLLHTRFVDVQRESRKLGPAIVAGVSGLEALSAKVYVDCSGSADVARAAGCGLLPPGEFGTLPASLMFFVRERPDAVEPQLPPGWFKPVECAEDLPMTSVWPNGPGGKAIKLKVIGHDSGDTEGFTQLEMQARRRQWEVLDYYQRQEKKPWHFDHASPIIGLRETRCIAGDYVLTVDNLRAACAFDDAVARGVFYLDGMRPDDETRTYFLSKEEQCVPPYHIPFRSLIARDADNLLMAGRCFSADQLALSSARTMTTCAMMGQAAGIAAAWSVDHGHSPRELDSGELRRQLEQYGANLDINKVAGASSSGIAK